MEREGEERRKRGRREGGGREVVGGNTGAHWAAPLFQQQLPSSLHALQLDLLGQHEVMQVEARWEEKSEGVLWGGRGGRGRRRKADC